MPDNTIFIVDGYNIIFRSYFAFLTRPLRNAQGENTSAIFGFFRTIAAIIREYHPNELCIALDSTVPTFRHQQYPQYKATRDSTPDDLKAQFPRIEDIITALHLPTVRVEEYEADDVIASLVRQYRGQGAQKMEEMQAQQHRREFGDAHAPSDSRDYSSDAHIPSNPRGSSGVHAEPEGRAHCVIISSDKDLMQLIGDGVSMMKPAKQGFEHMGASEVMQQKGVQPSQIGDYLALLGDASDNIPGVSGIGQKGAAKLLGQYGTLDGIYAHLDDIGATAQARKLAAGKDAAMLSRKLVTLVDTLDIDVPADGYPVRIQMADAAFKTIASGEYAEHCVGVC